MSLPDKPHRKECLNIIDYASYFLKHGDIPIENIIRLIEIEITRIKKVQNGHKNNNIRPH